MKIDIFISESFGITNIKSLDFKKLILLDVTSIITDYFFTVQLDFNWGNINSIEAAHENAQRHRQLSLYGRAV
jgi:hypothetical protein